MSEKTISTDPVEAIVERALQDFKAAIRRAHSTLKESQAPTK